MKYYTLGSLFILTSLILSNLIYEVSYVNFIEFIILFIIMIISTIFGLYFISKNFNSNFFYYDNIKINYKISFLSLFLLSIFIYFSYEFGNDNLIEFYLSYFFIISLFSLLIHSFNIKGQITYLGKLLIDIFYKNKNFGGK